MVSGMLIEGQNHIASGLYGKKKDGGKMKKGLIQYFKYSVVGLSCGAIDLGVLNGLLYFFPTRNGVMLAVFNTIAYSLAVLNSYIWNSRFTFQESSNHSYKQFFAFIAQAIISLVISNLVFVGGVALLSMFAFVPRWLINNIAKLTSMFCSSTSSFFFNKFFVFRSKSGPRKRRIYE